MLGQGDGVSNHFVCIQWFPTSFIFKRKGKITVEAFRNSNIAIDQKSSVIIRAAKRITALQSSLCLREQKSKNSFCFFLICSSSIYK